MDMGPNVCNEKYSSDTFPRLPLILYIFFISPLNINRISTKLARQQNVDQIQTSKINQFNL